MSRVTICTIVRQTLYKRWQNNASILHVSNSDTSTPSPKRARYDKKICVEQLNSGTVGNIVLGRL